MFLLIRGETVTLLPRIDRNQEISLVSMKFGKKDEGFFTYLLTQCAAVKTCLLSISEPPQKRRFLWKIPA